MKVEILRLLFDFGLLVLIWIVQLIIYPSFLYYTKEQLVPWHEKYTLAISLIVIPLMCGQLITSLLPLLNERNVYLIGSLIIITLVWISTFTLFVPMHNTIASGLADKRMLQQLVNYNWVRTCLWSVIFLWSLLRYVTH